MSSRRFLLVLPLLLALLPLHARETPKPGGLAAQARLLVEDLPSALRWIGLSEVQRAAGERPLALQTLQRAAAAPEGRPHLTPLRDLMCWQMLPTVRADVPGYRRQVEKLRESGTEASWLPVHQLYLALLEQDRAALLAAAGEFALPERYPTVLAEQSHLSLLQELKLPPVRAGLEVISQRSPDSLHALRDLDRGLTRETAFLRLAGREAEAKKIEAVRDRLRQGYLKASRHLVERLFALHLLGMTKERDDLLAKARAVPYLTDRQKLGALLDQVDEGQVWRQVLQPLLESEVKLLQSPPDLGRLQTPVLGPMKVEAKAKSVREDITTYEGAVQVRLGNLHITCERLSVIQDAGKAGTTLTGDGTVVVWGVVWNILGLESVRADRFSFSSDTGGFAFGGDVRVKQAKDVLKLRSCSVTWSGEVRDPRSLLDDFRDAPDVTRRLALLAPLMRVYGDEELPAEVRYLLALSLLRPHLTWHAPHLPPRKLGEEKMHMVEKENDHGEDVGRWREALSGEEWMLADVPEKVRETLRQAEEKRADDAPQKTIQKEQAGASFFWRIKDPSHADVARAQRLLDGVREGDLGRKARRWAAEVRRNNTVLTFDVLGGYAPGKDAPVVMDARNADQVAFKLYRVRRPDDLLWVADRIGDDFLYRDYGLQYGEDIQRLIHDRSKRKQAIESVRADVTKEAQLKKPQFRAEDLVRQWDARPADLKTLALSRGRWYDDDGDDGDRDADAHYFDDACGRFRGRIEKRYRPEARQLSSWHCDRIVTVPGAAVPEPGAYVLLAEANGQTAYVPLLVDPLSLTLRRCRDGVFVLASNSEGKEPIAGASVHGKGMLGEAVTDAAGAAFARLFAAGERAILVHKDGRFAIGGFGRLFDGIYVSPLDREWHGRDRLYRLRESKEYSREPLARVYADRHLVAAYTDRPTYRPGQEVHFKLIVRRLEAEKRAGGESREFRAEDFDVTSRMELLPDGTRLRYAVLDPRGREVADGALVLNDHGTAAASVPLNEETATGLYSLRVHVGGMDRLVPEVFAVKHYRRPTFELKVAGVPEKLKQPRDLTLELTGRYYFGMPVASGHVTARLVRAEQWKPLAETDGKLDEAGLAKLNLELPERLDAGNYHVICSLTDDSGRVVSQSLPVEIEGPQTAREGKGLAALLRFVPIDQPLTITTPAAEVIAEQAGEVRLAFRTEKGTATVKLSRPGWHTLWTGQESTDVFVYGGRAHPWLTEVPRRAPRPGPRKPGQEPEDDPIAASGWVNLTDYHAQEDGHRRHAERDGHQLLALFDRQHARIGDRLRVLVYAPYQRARLLFTIEGRTVVDYFITWTPAGESRYHVIEIPIKERHWPNFYLQGRILFGEPADEKEKIEKRFHEDRIEQLRKARDIDEGEDPRWCRIDVLDPGKTPGQEKLKVEVQADRADYRPGDEVGVQLKVTDLQGRPRVAEVSLGAVDESVYVFGEDGIAYLPQLFGRALAPQQFAPKAWRISVGDRWDLRKHGLEKQDQAIKQLEKAMQEAKSASGVVRSALLPLTPALADRPAVPPAALGGELPATSFALARLRADFRETAAWQPQLRTDAEGFVKTSFKLPDSLTQYRLTAVALTRETEIGIGKTSLRAGLPLAVRLILPRFAVEKDRLLAIGLIHNNGDRDRSCRVNWEVEGAAVDGPHSIPDWRVESNEGKTLGQGTVKVPAGGTARVGVWLAPSRAGTARIVFRCADAKDADAETRTLPIQPLGRPREVAHNHVLSEASPQQVREAGLVGSFNQQARLTLPAGFAPQDLRISLSCVDAVQALDGLGYLVEYPYGCVEQTMSRFLPAVMVKHASQRAPIRLPPEVAARLPEVLQRGLARLYNFQHPDGSWGWFNKDARDVAMTTYVVYGLARCQASGVTVDRAVLDRGCDALKAELRKGQLGADTAARAWLAVALAGRAELIDLQTFAQRAAQQATPEARANFALACRWVGLNEEGERLWALLRDWQPEGADRQALKLNAQVAFGAPFDDCRQTARRLLALRTGDRWEHTRATSWAVEALANLLAYVPERVPVRRVRVMVGGKAVLDVADPTDLKQLAYRVHLLSERLPAQDPLEIVLAADCDEPMRYTIRTVGMQRLDRLEPEGKRIQLRRSIETLEGKPVTGPLKVGQVVAVRLEVDLEQDEQYVIVEDRRPAGCEFADERLAGRSALSAAHFEFRDDRVCAFYPSLRAGRHEIVYYLRAETPGASHLLPGCAYPMYAEKVRGETGSARLEIKEP